jgi:hypothetical protein
LAIRILVWNPVMAPHHSGSLTRRGHPGMTGHKAWSATMSQTCHHMVSHDERPRPGTYPGQCRMRTTNAKRRESSSLLPRFDCLPVRLPVASPADVRCHLHIILPTAMCQRRLILRHGTQAKTVGKPTSGHLTRRSTRVGDVKSCVAFWDSSTLGDAIAGGAV